MSGCILFSIMKRKSFLSLTAALLAMIGASSAWHAWDAARTAEAAASRARETRRALVAETAPLALELAVAERRLEELRARLGENSPPRPAIPAGASVGPGGRVTRSTPDSKDPPAAHAQAMELLKAGLPVKYAAFYREAGLTPDRIAKFEAILVEHDGRLRDIRAAEASIKLDRTTAVPREAITFDGRRVQVMQDPAIAALRREEDARFRSDQVALLGEAGYAALQDFENGSESRAFVGELVGNLALTAAPLSLEQGRQLTRVLVAAGFKLKVEPETADWARILARAPAVLSPVQFVEFEAQLARARSLKGGYGEFSRRVHE